MKMNNVIELMHDALNRIAHAVDKDEATMWFLSGCESEKTVHTYKLFLQRMYKAVESKPHAPCKDVYDNVIEGLVDDGRVDIDCELISTMGIDASRYQDLSVSQKMQVHCLTTAAQTAINTERGI
tara:strand:- start:285 stop:659 length:375 start_codon:yes stop_codon:yes gene_type:complete